jgi:tetratricopeptide (TPR) repeat protein
MILILFIGFILRWQVLDVPMIEDERKNVIIAKSISFDPDHLNLPIEDPYVTHPLLNVYVTKLGISLLGDNYFGARFFHFLFGMGTLVIMFFLGKKYGNKEGLIALALLTFNQYHIHTSVRAENEPLLFFLIASAILCFWNYVEDPVRHQNCLLFLGPLCALAFLTKAVSVLLFFCFGIYILFFSPKTIWFKKKKFYITIFLFLILISPLLVSLSTQPSSQLVFQKNMYAIDNLKPRLTAINFYLVQIFAWLQNIDYRLLASWDYSIMDGVTGIFLLIGVVLSVRYWKNPYTKFLWIFFLCNMIPLTFFTEPGLKHGEFWWASLSVIPAICLTAVSFLRLYVSKLRSRVIILSFCLYAIVNSIFFVKNLEAHLTFPPKRFSAFVDDNWIVAEIYKDRKQWDQAITEMKRLIRLSPNDVENHCFLGWLYYQKGETKEALRHWFAALEVMPDHVSKYNLLYDVSNKLFEKDSILFTTQDERNPYYLAALLYYNRKYEEALKILYTISQDHPDHSLVDYYKGLVYAKLNKPRLAISTLLKYVQENPDNPFAHFVISRNHHLLNDIEKEELYLQRAIFLNPDIAYFHESLGNLYFRRGDTEKANKEYREAEIIRLML